MQDFRSRFPDFAWRLAAALIVLGGSMECAGPERAAARDIFVNNVAGDDRRDGASADTQGKAAGPLRTITRALKLADKGDRIILADTGEPYRESITLQAGRHSGLEGQPFTIVGNGAVLDGTRPIPPAVWEHVRGDIFRFRPPRMAHQLLYLDGKPAERVGVGPPGDVPGLRAFPDLEPLQWCLYDRHVYFRTEPGSDPAGYALSHTALPVGITVYETRHVLIRRLVVQGYQLDGVNAHDSVFDLTLAGLVCRGNGRSGISVGGASRVLIESCLLGNNGVAQLRTEGFSRTRVVNSDLIAEPLAPAVVRQGGEVQVEPPAADAETAGAPVSTAGASANPDRGGP